MISYRNRPKPKRTAWTMLRVLRKRLACVSCLIRRSRLGCQVKVTEDMNNMDVTIPANTRNFYVDGHVPKPH